MRCIIIGLLLAAQISYANPADNSIRCKSRDGNTELKIAIAEDKTASIVSFKNRGKTLVSNLSAKAFEGQTQLVVSGAGFTFIGDQGFSTAQVAYQNDGNSIFKTDIFCKYPETATTSDSDSNL